MRKEQKMEFVGIWGRGCLHCTQSIFQQINASQYLNTQGDREFQALSEYIITFLKMYFYIVQYHSTDPNAQNLCANGIQSILMGYLRRIFNIILEQNEQMEVGMDKAFISVIHPKKH